MNLFKYFLIISFISSSIVSKQSLGFKKKMVSKEVIEKIFDITVEEFPDEGVIKATFPRTDIQVTIQDWPLDPFAGLSSWVGFQKGTKKGIESMIMGDIALREEEVNPVMSVALEHGIEITALHNHFFFDNPKIYFMHINGEGKTKELAQTIKSMLDTSKSTHKKTFFENAMPTKNNITAEPLEKILQVKGQIKKGMFKIVIGRTAQAGCGCIIGKNMGINTWATFSGTDDNAIVDGDFAVLEDELQNVLKALRAAHINIVAIHNHMTHEKPRFIFIHYFGQGKATQLAQGLKSALEKNKYATR